MPTTYSDAIAFRVGPGHGLGPDVARSVVRKVLELAAEEHPAGWSHDEWCPPEELRGACRDDCTACYSVATEAMKRG